MFRDYKFAPVPESRQERLFAAITEKGTPGVINAGTAELRIANLPFYTNVQLLQCSCATKAATPYLDFFLIGNLNAANPTLHRIADFSRKEDIFALNESAGVVITEETVLQYIKFVFGCVWVSTPEASGVLRLVDNPATAQITEDCESGTVEAVRTLLRLPTVAEFGEGMRLLEFEVDAIVLHDHRILNLVLTVTPDGVLAIKSQKVLAKEMPIRPVYLKI